MTASAVGKELGRLRAPRLNPICRFSGFALRLPIQMPDARYTFMAA
jgi:hypothetical protein